MGTNPSLVLPPGSVDCRIARQYLCQTAAVICGICTLCFTAIQGQKNIHGYILFVWIYGIFCGGYHYSLKMYTYERVRARNFARTWGFVQCSQSLPIALGIPIAGYMNLSGTGKEGYYFSSACSIIGCFLLFFVDLHRRNLNRHKHLRANGTSQLCTSETCPQRRKLSFSQEPDNCEQGLVMNGTTLTIGSELFIPQATEKLMESSVAAAAAMNGIEKPELTCISEEGIADMDLPDNLLDELDYVGDCITSCNKVENYLMLSEFENNLNVNDGPATNSGKPQNSEDSTERRRRKLSMLTNLHHRINEESDEEQPPNHHHARTDSEESDETLLRQRSSLEELEKKSGSEGAAHQKGGSKKHLHLWPPFGHNNHHNKSNGAASNSNSSSSSGSNGQQKRLMVSSSSLDGKRSNCLLSVMDEASD